ncbi:hypothetical protein ABW19_dt0201823 [Dactylella cylindrospora]|nr:hypothetical protein ABW19_dt0201823 [Dactylella cylindrospora]
MASKKALAVIAGVGPGTGTAIAKKFASLYNVVLLARSPSSYETAANEINSSGGSALGLPVDVLDEASVSNVFKTVDEKFPGQPVAAVIYNVGGKFVRKPFLEQTLENFKTGLEGSAIGAFIFAKAALPHLVSSASHSDLTHPPTLIFTGATASFKANPQLESFSPGKFALRSLSQSLAKEFGPEGVHVSHVIVDGIIDTPATKAWGSGLPDSKIQPDAIAETYWSLHQQPRTCWSWELDIRPYVEKW